MPKPTAPALPARRLLAALAPLAMVATLAGAGCSDDTQKEIDEAAEAVRSDAEDVARDAGARAVGEAFRVSLETNDIAENDGYRSVEALQDAADDLPGDPDISGIEDGDGDGLDDDGRVEVTVDGGSACVVIPETGTDAEVTDGAC